MSDVLASIYSVMGFDYEEAKAQVQATKEQRSFNNNAGKVELRYDKSGSFTIPNPADKDKPEGLRTSLTPKKITGILAFGSFELINWDGDHKKAEGEPKDPKAPKGPLCKSVGYKSLKPGSRVPEVSANKPQLPMGSIWDFVRRYEPVAERMEKVIENGSEERYSKTKLSCLDCMNRNDKNSPQTHDGWFQQCGNVGEIDMIVTHVAGHPLDEPLIGFLKLPGTSTRGLGEFLKTTMNKLGAEHHMGLVVSVEVEVINNDSGNYAKLKFIPEDPANEELQKIVLELYTNLKTTQAALGAGPQPAGALPPGQSGASVPPAQPGALQAPAAGAAPAAGKPAPF